MNSATTTSTTSLKKVEEDLTEQKADKVSDESYLGKPGQAEIFDICTDTDSENVIEFYVWLPNSKEGRISFSQYEFEQGKVDSFLDNIDCTVEDLDRVYQDIPVTYTKHNGWITVYSSEDKRMESTYRGTSSWYNISKTTGNPTPNSNLIHLLNIPFYLSIGASLVSWEIWPVIYGVMYLFFIWFFNAAHTGMSMPHRKSIQAD